MNSVGPNPFGKPSDGKTETLATNSIKCPTCGSNITYSPELGLMMCRNCGNVYSTDTLEPRGCLGIAKERDYVGDVEMAEDDKKRHEILCDSCGAILITDEHSMSTMCPFCGSPMLITRRMTREFKPDYIIPFKIDKDQAEQKMKEWLASRKYTPLGFKTKSRLTKMTALYVPFWVIDCQMNSDMTGTGFKIEDLEKTIYEVHSRMTYHVKGVPFDASLNVANKLMEAIEPFDYSEMVKFESKYLQGFYANKYDLLPMDIADKIMKRMDKFASAEVDVIANKYDKYEVRPEKNLNWLSEIHTKYCLLPVWFMTVDFEGSQYQFAVNGQTGEASGRAPTSSGVDVADNILNFLSRWKWIPFSMAVIIPFLLAICVFNTQVSAFITFAVYALITLGALLGVFFLAYLTLFIVRNLFLSKITNTAYETNDYDKDPGLDYYLDTKSPFDLKVDDKPLRLNVTDDEGNTIKEFPLEI